MYAHSVSSDSSLMGRSTASFWSFWKSSISLLMATTTRTSSSPRVTAVTASSCSFTERKKSTPAGVHSRPLSSWDGAMFRSADTMFLIHVAVLSRMRRTYTSSMRSRPYPVPGTHSSLDGMRFGTGTGARVTAAASAAAAACALASSPAPPPPTRLMPDATRLAAPLTMPTVPLTTPVATLRVSPAVSRASPVSSARAAWSTGTTAAPSQLPPWAAASALALSRASASAAATASRVFFGLRLPLPVACGSGSGS